MFASPGEIAFHIGSIAVYYYGIIMACSLSLGIFSSYLIAKFLYKDFNAEIILDVAPNVIICALIGARLYYCALSLKYYLPNFIEIFNIRQGGLSIHGAILGGLIAGLIYCKKRNLPTLKICDIYSYGLILGQALGRWGNFFNSEAFGKPTNNLLKVYIPIYKRPIEYLQNQYFHPTFLYESILDLIIFFILIFFVRKFSKNKNGIVFFSYLILYSLARIAVEQLRIDSVLNIAGIPFPQIISAIIIVISVVSILKITYPWGKFNLK